MKCTRRLITYSNLFNDRISFGIMADDNDIVAVKKIRDVNTPHCKCIAPKYHICIARLWCKERIARFICLLLTTHFLIKYWCCRIWNKKIVPFFRCVIKKSNTCFLISVYLACWCTLYVKYDSNSCL